MLEAKRLKAILETVHDGIITIDSRGTIETVNPATCQIFGYDESEMIGQNVKMLMPNPYQSEHDQYLRNYCETGQAKVIGIGREVEGMRKDGSQFPIELAVTQMEVDDQLMFTGIVRDITERRQAEKVKAEFISTVSHELRTPLTSIRGSLGLLKGGVAGELSEKGISLLDIASNNTERLLMLINDILDLSKIEAGKMDFNFDKVSLAPFLQRVIDDNQAYGTQHGVVFELENSAADAVIWGDEHRLAQVMANLLSNAAKFSPDGSVVKVHVVRRKHQIRVSVIDQGLGIPDSLKQTVFEKFTQADSSDTRKVGGTGLGLSISKLMIEKHNGLIDFISEEGIGTTFYFDLPEMIVSSGEGLTATTIESGRILVCEDDPDVSTLIRMMLSKAGYDTDAAFSAKEAEDLLHQNRYLAMTLDVMLPDEDGRKVREKCRESEKNKSLPILFVSAIGNQVKLEMTEQGDQDDLTGFLQKPIDADKLSEFFSKTAQKSKKTVLHVEDDSDIRKLVSMLLPEDIHLIVASSLQEAKQSINNNEVDLLLLDIGLPDGSGLDLLDEINQSDPKPEVIIFSADDYRVMQVKGVEKALIKSKTSDQELVETIKSTLN